LCLANDTANIYYLFIPLISDCCLA